MSSLWLLLNPRRAPRYFLDHAMFQDCVKSVTLYSVSRIGDDPDIIYHWESFETLGSPTTALLNSGNRGSSSVGLGSPTHRCSFRGNQENCLKSANATDFIPDSSSRGLTGTNSSHPLTQKSTLGNLHGLLYSFAMYCHGLWKNNPLERAGVNTHWRGQHFSMD